MNLKNKILSDIMESKPTVFPFSSQVIEGTGFPVALHSKATSLPICTFLSLGTLSILAGAKKYTKVIKKHRGRREKHHSTETSEINILCINAQIMTQ